MWSEGERREMEDWFEVRRAMGSLVDMREVEDGEGKTMEVVMCSTCSGFLVRKKRIAMDPDEEVLEVVKEAEKMRDLMQAVLQHGPFQEKEPAEATKEQWQVLRRRRMIMMETKRCPACSHSLLNMCAACSRSLEEDKAAGSKEKKKKSSREEVSQSLGGKERKKIATEDEAMVAKKSKRSREEGKRSSSGLKKKKKKAKSEDKEGSGSEKKAKRSSEVFLHFHNCFPLGYHLFSLFS